MRSHIAKVEAANLLYIDDFATKYIPSDLLTYTPTARKLIADTTIATNETTETTETSEITETIETTEPPTYTISFKGAPSLYSKPETDIADAELESCFTLLESTSREDYATSSIGWRPAAKRAEMREVDMRYLLVRRRDSVQAQTAASASASAPSKIPGDTKNGTENGKNIQIDDVSDPKAATPAKEQEQEQEKKQVRAITLTTTNSPLPIQSTLATDPTIQAFTSYQITLEESQTVLYIYEIHLFPFLRNQRLGTHLFSLLEHIARATGMEKVMLTVFRKNEVARRVYERLGYTVDENSPCPRRLRGGVVKAADYIILSKKIQDGEEDDLDERESKRRRKGSR